MSIDPHILMDQGVQCPDFTAPPAHNGVRAVELAVRHALSAFATPSPLTVLVNDPQRNTLTRAVLGAIARQAGATGIRILVAAGSHRFGAAQRESFERTLLGDHEGPAAALSGAKVQWHDCRAEDLVSVGEIWRANPWLLEDDPVLAIGSVEPHYFAGLTGAHKTATVGCAAYHDIESNHNNALGDLCRPCLLEGNPVYEGVANMLWALMSLRPLSCVNLVQAETRNGPEVLAAFGGEPFATLMAAAPVASGAFVRKIGSPADAIIAEVTGPLGRSIYQADKGIKNNEWALRDGGCLVLVAPCPEGIGQDDFVDLLRQAPTHRQARELVERRGYRLGDHKAVRLRRLTDPCCRNVKVYLVSDGIDDAQASVLGMRRSPTIDDALASAGLSPRRDRVFYLSDAGNRCLVAS